MSPLSELLQKTKMLFHICIQNVVDHILLENVEGLNIHVLKEVLLFLSQNLECLGRMKVFQRLSKHSNTDRSL